MKTAAGGLNSPQNAPPLMPTMKRPSTREKLPSTSSTQPQPYFSRSTQNNPQNLLDFNQHLPPKQPMINKTLNSYDNNGYSKTPNERKRRDTSGGVNGGSTNGTTQSWSRPPMSGGGNVTTTNGGNLAQLANATPKQLQNSFLQRFFPSQSSNTMQNQTNHHPFGIVHHSQYSMALETNSQRGSSSQQRDISMKNLRSSADGGQGGLPGRQQSFLFNNKHRKVKKTSTNRALQDALGQGGLNNTQPLSLVSTGLLPSSPSANNNGAGMTGDSDVEIMQNSGKQPLRGNAGMALIPSANRKRAHHSSKQKLSATAGTNMGSSYQKLT